MWLTWLLLSRYRAETKLYEEDKCWKALRRYEALVWIHLSNEMRTYPRIWKNSTSLKPSREFGFRPCDTVTSDKPTGLPGTNPEPWKCISQHMQMLLLSTPPKKEYIQDTFNRPSLLVKVKTLKYSPVTSQFHSRSFLQGKLKKSHHNNHHSLLPFPNQAVLQNLQSNHKNWQTWRYLQHCELHYVSEI